VGVVAGSVTGTLVAPVLPVRSADADASGSSRTATTRSVDVPALPEPGPTT